MANILKRERVHALRKRGMSISEISTITDTSKSTVSYWCRNICLSKNQLEALQRKSKHAGRKQFLFLGEKRRKERLIRETQAKKQGGKDIRDHSKRDLFMVGLGLYWGEGYKHGNGELGFTNSDPLMIHFFLQWLYKIYEVDNKNIILRISINEMHKERIDKIVSYWSKITNLPKKQFTKPSYIKTINKKRYLNHHQYFGVLRVKVRKGSLLKQRILGSLTEVSGVQF